MVEGLQKQTRYQKGDRRRPAEPPPMAKLVSHRDGIPTFWESSLKMFLPSFGSTGPLYRDPGTIICPITSPRFVEANESGENFLNGY